MWPAISTLAQMIWQCESSSGSLELMNLLLIARNTPSPVELDLSFLYTSKSGGNISLFLTSGVSHDSVPKMISGFTLSTAFKSCSFLFLTDLQFRFSSLSSLGTSLAGFLALGDFLLFGDDECAGGPGDVI